MTQKNATRESLLDNEDTSTSSASGKGKGSLKAAQLAELPIQSWTCEHVLLWLQTAVFNTTFMQNNTNNSPMKSSTAASQINTQMVIPIEQLVENYIEAFATNDVSGSVLQSLTSDDIKELGITKLGHRRTLELALAKLKEEKAEQQQLAAQQQQANTAPSTTTTPKRPRNTASDDSNDEESKNNETLQQSEPKRQKVVEQEAPASTNNSGTNSKEGSQHTQIVNFENDETMDEETRKLIKQLQEEDAKAMQGQQQQAKSNSTSKLS